MLVDEAGAPMRPAICWFDDRAWWFWDLAAGTSCCSPRWYRDLGLEPQDTPVPTTALLRLLHPGDREGLDDVVLAARSDGDTTYDLRLRLRHREGHYVVVRSHGTIVVEGPPEAQRGWLTGVHDRLEHPGWPGAGPLTPRAAAGPRRRHRSEVA